MVAGIFDQVSGLISPISFEDSITLTTCKSSLPEIIFSQKLLKPEGVFVLEHNNRNGFENAPYFVKEKKYGDTLFSIFQQA